MHVRCERDCVATASHPLCVGVGVGAPGAGVYPVRGLAFSSLAEARFFFWGVQACKAIRCKAPIPGTPSFDCVLRQARLDRINLTSWAMVPKYRLLYLDLARK